MSSKNGTDGMSAPVNGTEDRDHQGETAEDTPVVDTDDEYDDMINDELPDKVKFHEEN